MMTAMTVKSLQPEAAQRVRRRRAASPRELPLRALICCGRAALSRPALCPLSENSSGCKFTLGGISSQPALGWKEAFRVSRLLLLGDGSQVLEKRDSAPRSIFPWPPSPWAICGRAPERTLLGRCFSKCRHPGILLQPPALTLVILQITYGV